MWGSGKTWLGGYFLDELRKQKVCTKLRVEFGDTAVDSLLNAYYVLIDFRGLRDNTILPLTELLKVEVTRHLFYLPVNSCMKSAKMELVHGIETDWTLLTVNGIVQQFSELYGHFF
jgi:hypothetical protein